MMSPLTSFIFLSHLVILLNGCLLNSTHCTCGDSPSGGSCLRYSTTSGKTHLCDSYECGPGTVCDCMGTSLCTLSSCPSSRRVFRPLPDSKIEGGELTPCKLATDATCMTVIGNAPKPSMTTSPSASTTPDPSLSSSVTPTPSPSQAVTPSPSTTTKPAASSSQAPVRPLARGSFCSDETAPCEEGSSCSCNRRCEMEVDLEFTILGDDSAKLFACGEEIGFSRGWDHPAHFSYTGPCSDVIVEVSNEDGHYSAFAMAVDYGGTLYSTGLGRGLSAVVEENPPSGYLTYPGYDFSHWKTPIIHTDLLREGSTAFLMFNEEYGALPIAFRDGPSPASTFVYKVSMKFCENSSDWQL